MFKLWLLKSQVPPKYPATSLDVRWQWKSITKSEEIETLTINGWIRPILAKVDVSTKEFISCRTVRLHSAWCLWICLTGADSSKGLGRLSLTSFSASFSSSSSLFRCTFLWYCALKMSNFFPLYRTEAHPHPDFFSGLIIFLQLIAQALGEQNIVSVSWDLIFPSSSKSPMNFWPYKKCHKCLCVMCEDILSKKFKDKKSYHVFDGHISLPGRQNICVQQLKNC